MNDRKKSIRLAPRARARIARRTMRRGIAVLARISRTPVSGVALMWMGIALFGLADAVLLVAAFVPGRLDPAFNANDVLMNPALRIMDTLAGPPAPAVYAGGILLAAAMMLPGMLLLKTGDRMDRRQRCGY